MASINGIFKLTFIVAVLLLFTVGTAQPCPTFCRFRLCFRLGNSVFELRQNPSLLLRPASRPVGPFPCQVLRSGRLRELRNVIGAESSVAPARTSLPFVPISEFRPVRPSFQPNFFTFGFLDLTERDSIVRRGIRGSQFDALQELCARLPIRSHQLLRRDGSVRRTIVPRGRTACVGFRTRIASLDVELLWNTQNDFNLRLVEPDGTEINRANPISINTGGRLSGDSGSSGCIRFFAAERVRYLPANTVPSGSYTIRIDNVNQCSVSTEYTLRVSTEGSVLFEDTDTVTAQGNNVIVRSFTI